MNLTELRALTDQFTQEDGRRPRLLLAALGDQADEFTLRLYAAAFADAGFDIDVCPQKQNPHDTARMAAENDVHAIGLCAVQAQDEEIVRSIQEELSRLDRDDIPCFIRTTSEYKGDPSSLLVCLSSDQDNYLQDAHQVITGLIEQYL